MENRFSRAKRLIWLSAKTFSAGSRKNELQFSEKKKRLLTRLGGERRWSTRSLTPREAESNKGVLFSQHVCVWTAEWRCTWHSKSGHLCVKKTQKMTDGTVTWALIVPVSLVLWVIIRVLNRVLTIYRMCAVRLMILVENMQTCWMLTIGVPARVDPNYIEASVAHQGHQAVRNQK